MAAIIVQGGPSTATNIAVDGPGGSFVVRNQLQHDSPWKANLYSISYNNEIVVNTFVKLDPSF